MAIDRVGAVLKSRYRIDRLLHNASDADVYAGTDLKGGRVAIKCWKSTAVGGAKMGAVDWALRGSASASSDWVRRAYLANSVGHSSAVGVIDDGVDADGFAFVVRELIQGQDLDQLRTERGGRLPTRLVCGIADQCLDLLGSAHAQDVFHGALAPTNMFWTRAGQLKVLGFGSYARLHTAQTTQDTQDPPIILVSDAVQRDLAAVAEVMFSALRGQSLEEARAAQPNASVAELLPTVPARIAAVIERGLTADPARHWSDADDMRGALERAFALELGSPIDHALQPMARNNQEETSPVWAWLAVTALGGVLIAWSAWWPVGNMAATQPTQPLREITDVSAVQDVAFEPSPFEPSHAVKSREVTHTRTEPSAAAPLDIVHSVGAGETEPALHVRKPTSPGLRLPIHTPHAASGALGSPVVSSDRLCAQLVERRRIEGASNEISELWTQHCGAL